MRILHLLGALEHPTMHGSLRHYHFLKHLAASHEVTLLALLKEGGEEVTPEARGEIGALVERLELFEARGPRRFERDPDAGVLRRLAGRARRSLAIRAAVRRLGSRVDELRRRERFDVALCHRKELYPVIAGLGDLPAVVDACDATPLRLKALLGYGPISDRLWTVLRYARSEWVERRLARHSRRLVYISPRDRDAAVPSGAEARVIPNGIDLEYWRDGDRGEGGGTGGGDVVVLSGVMDYPPNTEAAEWLAREVLPRVRRERPEAELLLVGRDPTPEVRALGEDHPGVTVTGRVDDLRPWLARARVFAAGLRSASGQQNKVLEAMAMELPVVATPSVAAGFRMEGAGEPPLEVAAGADAFAERIVGLLEDEGARSRLAGAGRRFVEAHFDWERSASAVEEECRAAATPVVRPRVSVRGWIRRLKETMRLESERVSLPGWAGLWLALLPLLIVGATALGALDGKTTYKAIIREDGIAETVQAFAWLGVAGFGVAIGYRLHRSGAALMGWISGLLALVALFVVGEEISWGQRIFGWSTPPELEALNRQGETNVHNVTAVEDLFRWGKILIGAWGACLPLLARPLARGDRLVQRFAAPAPAAGGREPGGRRPGHDLLLVPPAFLAPFFVFPFLWGLYRMFAPRPPVYEWAIAEFGEIVELQLALGVVLFAFLVHRVLRREGMAGDPALDLADAAADATGDVAGDGADDAAGAVPGEGAGGDTGDVPGPLDALEDAGVHYALLRGHEELASAEGDREVDVLIPERALPDLARELGRRGFFTLPAAGHEPHRFFVRYDRERGGWDKVDVVTDLLYGRSAFAYRHPAPESFLRDGRQRAGVRVPRRADEFVALLMHCLLDKGAVAEKHERRLRSLSGALREEGREEELARSVDGTLGPAVRWADVSRSLDGDEWTALLRRARRLRRQLFRAGPAGTTWRWIRSRVLRLLGPLISLFRRPGFSVVLLAADGAGKTTLAHGLVQRWPLPARVVYMGTNRKANTVGLPGGDSLVRAGERLRGFPLAPARWLGKALVSGVKVVEGLQRAAVAHLCRSLGGLVVFDRFVYDGWRSGRASGVKGGLKRWLLEAPCPTPDLAVVLDAPAEVLRGRQDEHPLEELRDQRAGYRDLARRLPVPVEVVDADRGPEAVRRDVVELVSTRYAGQEPTTKAGAERTAPAPAGPRPLPVG